MTKKCSYVYLAKNSHAPASLTAANQNNSMFAATNFTLSQRPFRFFTSTTVSSLDASSEVNDEDSRSAITHALPSCLRENKRKKEKNGV
jgi:hypothetical protein